MRNPWERWVLVQPAPEGRRNRVSQAVVSFAPPRRKENKECLLPFHGFRVGPLRGRAAPPVATIRRPCRGSGEKHVGRVNRPDFSVARAKEGDVESVDPTYYWISAFSRRSDEVRLYAIVLLLPP